MYGLPVACFLLLATLSFSQNVFSSEEDLKKQANKLFEEEEFGKAYPLFSQLLSLYPKDAQYNYKFGTCLLFASSDKEKAIPYIEYAAKRQKQDVDKEVFFYLGKAYHLNYRFADAIKSYNTYKGVSSSKQLARYDVDRQIEMCESGKKLLKSVTELSVLDKKDVPSSDFFRSYNLSEFNAKLIVKPDDLKSSLDKKKNDQSLMYLAPDRDQIYYSSYGEDGKNGRDIYYVTRSSGGDLSKPTRVSDAVNTKYDEDYVFLHPNGKSLYFCSKGHNSMGGYDIFKSEWDNSTQSWGSAVNMDFAINTPDDDILFISDAEDKSAYFSSRRESPDGRLTVYKIKLERKPLDLAIITGTLTKTVGDRMAKATITVTKILKDEVVGVFNTNAADGSYTLKLPNGGKFVLSVESAGFKKSSEVIVVPNQQEIRPMKQEITLVNENGQDKILVKNEFDALVDSADLQKAIAYIKAKASLEISPAEEQISAAAVEENTPATTTEAKTETKSNAPVTNSDIIEMAYQDAKETQKDANELLKNSEAAKLLSRQKNELSIQKYNEAQELMKTAETLTNQEEKLTQMDRATKIQKEAEIMSKESALALTLSNQMETQAEAKQQQADAEMKYAKDLDNAIKTGANETKMNELLARKEDLDKKSEVLDASFPPDLNKEINETQAQASKSMAKYLDTQQEIEDLQGEAKRLRTEAEKTTNEGVKQNLNQQAEEMEKEAETKKKDAEVFSATAKKQQAQADSLKNNATLTSAVMKQIEGTTPAPTTASTPENTALTATAVTETTTETSTPPVQTPEQTPANTTPAPKSPPVDVFAEKIREAESKTNDIERAEAAAAAYQFWTDSLDRQVAELNKQLAATTAETYKEQIRNKISEVQSVAEEKRQKAAENRNKVDNLKMQQALAEASTVTPTNASTTTSTATTPETTSGGTPAPEDLTGTKNINAFYENRIRENTAIANEYERKVKEQILYEEWASSLYDESQRLKKDGSSGKAEDALNESKTKQALAIQSADEVTKIKAEKPELVATANLTPTQPTTLTAPETKTATSSTTASSSTSSETGTTTTPVSTTESPKTSETTTAVQPVNTNTPTTTAPSAQSGSQTSGQKTLATTPPASVTRKDEYTHFAALQNESVWAKNNADRQYKQSAEYQKEADKQFKESEELTAQIARSNDPNERKNLQNLSDMLDRSALKNQAKADSIKAIARNSEAESNSKRTEADTYLQSLDKAAYEEISTATGYKPETSVSSTTTKTESTTQPTVVSTTSETQTGTIQNEPAAVNTGTTATTGTETKTGTAQNEPAAVNTTAATSTETAKTNTVTESNVANTQAETATPPVNAETAVTKTETPVQPVSTETSVPKTESTTPTSTAEAATRTETTTEPASATKTATSTGSLNSPFASSAEMLKYYDALFDKLDLSGPTYSESKPIPVDAPMPEGLVFKVQIGAFRNPIPQDLFKGIKPITAETTPGGLKRYTAGLFQKFATANNAKTQVNNLGYRDAFIVAFFNGKRITINEAMAKAREAGETIDPSAVSSTATQLTGTASQTSAAGTRVAETTDVKSVSGLFYTIQIGVFSRPVNSTQLYNISPLNSERTDNGLIRYTTGRFLSEETATRAKNSIAAKGISDAFVIAYRDGKRIGLSSAKSMIDSEGSAILAKEKQEYSIIPTDTTTSETSGNKLTSGANLGIVFKVQVGAFKEQVPIAIANKLLANTSRGIKTFRDDNGLLVYTVGEFLEFESANSLKAQLVSSGLSDAFVIAFKDGKKISASAALEMIRNK